jgi:anti-sigma B factor antagonist
VDSPSLRITHKRIGDAFVVHAEGDVDLLGAPDLQQQLERAYRRARPPQVVVADLTEVRFLGSAGISVLLDVGLRCQQQDTPLSVVASRPATLEPLRVTGVNQVLLVVESLARLSGGSE